MVRIDPLGYGTKALVHDAGLIASSTEMSGIEYLSVVQVLPFYPIRGLERGLEGRVVLKITVTTAGRIIEPVVVQN